jgi:hypothetical protein
MPKTKKNNKITTKEMLQLANVCDPTRYSEGRPKDPEKAYEKASTFDARRFAGFIGMHTDRGSTCPTCHGEGALYKKPPWAKVKRLVERIARRKI